MSFDLDGYVDVAERIGIFRSKYPEGSLQPVNPERPFTIETIGNRVFIVYAAAAYRHPDDHLPGVGVAWEPFPGPTPYTKDSELMNAETAAWGRAIVAALAADTKKVASSEEVRNHRGDEATTAPVETGGTGRAPRLASEAQLKFLTRLAAEHYPPEGCPWPLTEDDGKTWRKIGAADAHRWIDELKAIAKEPKAERVGTLRTDVGASDEPAHPGSDDAAESSPALSDADSFSDTYDISDYSDAPF